MMDVMNNLGGSKLPANYNNIFFTGRGTTLAKGFSLFPMGKSALPQGKYNPVSMESVLKNIPPLMRPLHSVGGGGNALYGFEPIGDYSGVSQMYNQGRTTQSSSSQPQQRSSGGNGGNQSSSLSISTTAPQATPLVGIPAGALPLPLN